MQMISFQNRQSQDDDADAAAPWTILPNEDGREFWTRAPEAARRELVRTNLHLVPDGPPPVPGQTADMFAASRSVQAAPEGPAVPAARPADGANRGGPDEGSGAAMANDAAMDNNVNAAHGPAAG